MTPAAPVDWRWVPIRGDGGRVVEHAVGAHWPTTAREPRYDSACGAPDAETTIEGERGLPRCVRCWRKVILGWGAGG